MPNDPATIDAAVAKIETNWRERRLLEQEMMGAKDRASKMNPLGKKPI
jgi:hypothetical protein